jgi:hypothetical protein
MTYAGERYRFISLLVTVVSFSTAVFAQGAGPYARGLGGGEDALIRATGSVSLAEAPGGTAPDVYPPLPGSYKSSKQNPRVFRTPASITDMVGRINAAGSFSAQIFPKLADQVKAAVAAKVDWDAAYSGCDTDTYLHAFSYETAAGYADQMRSASQLSAAMNVRPGQLPPTGAAIVASRLALYAALVKAGANPPAGAPTADQAAAIARRILLAWASHGFRDQKANYLNRAEQFCDQNQFVPLKQSVVGLQIARGVIYSVDAQDLLQSIGAVNAKDVSELNAFHAAMFSLIREASNFSFTLPEVANRPDRTCERFSNHFGAHLLGLLSIARLFDDPRKFNAVLYGNDPTLPVDLFWTRYFNHAIYGEKDTPIACYKNPGPDSLTSHPSFQTAVVAPGEIEDRYRNANPEQEFGYSLGVLVELYNTGDLLKNAGFDAFSYRGTHAQTIEMATRYYACYGKNVGFKKAVTAENAHACPDYQQYIGQVVNGLESAVVLGAERFPQDPAITALEAPSKAGAGANLLDPIRFGRWRD